jgi:hypothetical protein
LEPLTLLIAVGIGLHNFGEGLAIGQSAAAGEIGLALVLIIGFGLHNATEGFGIVGPMSADEELPSWRYLFLLGLIGGGPTFIGTAVGEAWASDALAVVLCARGGLDPLRRQRAARRLPPLLAADARRLDDRHRIGARLRNRLRAHRRRCLKVRGAEEPLLPMAARNGRGT